MSYQRHNVLQAGTIQDVSLCSETASHSQNSHRKLPGIDFIFLVGPSFPLGVTCPDSPVPMAVVIFPKAMGSTTLSLQIRGQHWLTFPLWEVMAAPSLALGDRHQTPPLGWQGQVSLKIERAHMYPNHILDVFTLCYKAINKPGKSVRDETLSSMAC